MEKIIEVRDIFFKYDKEYILQNVSFDIEKGDFVGIIGANGTGKSTLIKLILGILKPDSGEILISGINPNKSKQVSSIGYVPQVGVSSGVEFPATVTEIVLMNMYKEIGLFKFAKRRHIEKVREILSIVGMTEYANRRFCDLSGGQQQRVVIAKALANNPEILILDEPTSGIDHRSEDALYELLDRLHLERKITIVMISHDIERLKKHSNRIIEVESFWREEA